MYREFPVDDDLIYDSLTLQWCESNPHSVETIL